MEQKLREIVAKIAETRPDFDVNADFRHDLDIDSMRALEIMYEIEQVFRVTIPQDRYSKVRNFQDLVQLTSSVRG